MVLSLAPFLKEREIQIKKKISIVNADWTYFFFILLFILFFILSLLMIFQSEACPKYKLQKITEGKWNLNFQFINYSGWVFSLNPECITRLTALFVTRHPISLEFRDWLKDTLIPDESFYATLSRVRGLDPETELVVMDTKTKTLHDYCVRISLWRLQNITCAGTGGPPFMRILFTRIHFTRALKIPC